MTILPITYLGNVDWFAHLAVAAVEARGAGRGRTAGSAVIDVGENWVKQTARNRCEIMTSTGVAALTVPVHGYGAKIATRDVRIDNSRRWQHTHWMSIVSGYRNSPFFEHYEWRFAPVYERRFEFLVDLDLELLSIVAPLLGLESIERIGAIAGYGATATSGAITISESWVEARPGDIDLRGKKALRRPTPPSYPATQPSGPVSHNSPHHPHHPHHPHAHEYTQVFSDRQPFVAGLSIVDLLFNEGPAARVFLELQ